MKDWPHAPVHRLGTNGAYMVTAGTYRKVHLFNSPARLDFLQDALFSLAEKHDWQLQAWAVFSNHYHFVALSEAPTTLPQMIRALHAQTAIEANRADGTSGRQVWFQYLRISKPTASALIGGGGRSGRDARGVTRGVGALRFR